MDRLSEKVKAGFRGKRIAVIGDIVADQFLHGTISRVSREAPVFILKHNETETRPGGAANAAANIASLGGEPLLVGLIGDDVNGNALLDALMGSGVRTDGIVTTSGSRTTTKVRVIGGQPHTAKKQVIRIDYENDTAIGNEVCERLHTNLEAAANDSDAIILSDYNYGVADPSFFESVMAIARKRSVPVVIDSRFRIDQFAGATSATPNQEEVEKLLGKPFEETDCDGLRHRLGLGSLLITLGGRGMMLSEKGRPPLAIPAVGSDQPLDVTGAGDTVIAAYTLGLAAGLGFSDAAAIANHAGGIVVMKRGTAVATAAELLDSLASIPSATSASNES
jgi:D-glycero-beta-D-manno-heptose-7-phosphate kinase